MQKRKYKQDTYANKLNKSGEKLQFTESAKVTLSGTQKETEQNLDMVEFAAAT